MLIYVHTNLFDSSAQVLVNTVNTVGVMGKGIALQFKKLYPEMFHEYQHFCENGELTVGKLWLYKAPSKWILNFPTKKNWRNKSQVEYIESGLKKFVDTYQDRGIESISFPQLGTGNGGLNWEKVVKPLMEKYLRPLPIKVYIHLYSKNNSLPEYKNVDEMRNWIESQPDALSVDEFKRDLISALSGGQSIDTGHDIEIINDQSIDTAGSGIFIKVKLDKNRQYVISQSDIVDLWTRLRDQGMAVDVDLPAAVLDNDDITFFESLLTRLSYVKTIPVHVGNGREMHALALERNELPKIVTTTSEI